MQNSSHPELQMVRFWRMVKKLCLSIEIAKAKDKKNFICDSM